MHFLNRSSMARLIVDVQFFRTSTTEYTVKELAVTDGDRTAHYIFKPPFVFEKLPPDLQTQARWLIQYHHGIKWNSGFIPAYLATPIICNLLENARSIYVKGREKADFIRDVSAKAVIELPERPTLQPKPAACFHHSRDEVLCSLNIVHDLHFMYFMQQ